MRGMASPSLVFLLLAAACSGSRGGHASTVTVGTEAPSYSAATLEGDTLSLADFRGEVVLLNLWATWCGPCIQEMPWLRSLDDRHREDGLQVVGISIDDSGSEEAIREVLAEREVGYKILHDPASRAMTVFDTHAIPLNLLIDREGVIRWRQTGFVAGGFEDPSFERALKEALEAQPKEADTP